MVQIAKYLFACVMLVGSRQIAATNENCDYVLCRTKAESGDGYYASGSAISSQFLMPDGSVITNSKESSISSDGIKRTFHELKKEADKFVYTGSSDKLGVPPIPGIPNIPKIPHIPAVPPSIVSVPYNSFSSSGSVGGSQHSSSYSSSQSSGSIQQVGSQQYQPVPAPVKITSYSKEHEIQKKVVSSQGPTNYPSGNIVGQYHTNQQTGHNSGAVSNSAVRFPSESLNQKQESAYYGQQSHNYNSAGQYVPAPVVSVPVAGSQSSYQKYESSSQKNATEVQPGFIPDLRPNTFATNVIDFGANNEHFNQIGHADLTPVISQMVPSSIPLQPEPAEEHYSSEGSVNVHKEYINKYNAVPIVVKLPPYAPHVKYEFDNNHIKTEEYGAGVKPAAVPLKVVQYGNEQQQASHSQAFVGTSGTNAAGRPTSHISNLVVHVGAPTASNSQSYQKESSSSHVSSSHQGAVPVPVAPLSYSSSSQYQSSGGAYSQQGSHQVPVYHAGGELTSSSASHDKQVSSSQTFGGFQSPVIVHGVPQNIPLDQQSTYGENEFSSGGYVDGVSEGVPIPILVHGVPQNQRFSSSSSSSSGSSYYSKGGQVSGSVVPGSAGFYYSGDASNKIHGASASIYDKLSANSDAESLCAGCIGGSSSSNIPIKNSYGISTSFSSSSSSVNGKKTSENREASVAVNDNGKVDSYHVKL